MHWRDFAQTLTITCGAIITSMLLYSLFMFGFYGVSPLDLYYWIYVGGFGSSFSVQNTLTKAAPLILTALCTALPARVGMTIIGGEGALIMGALAAACAGLALLGSSALVVKIGMALAGMLAGGLVIAAAGMLRHLRGVNETISSLLLFYIAKNVFNYLVEGPLRDPASLNKPSTYPLPEDVWIGTIMGWDVHWGLVYGIVFCLFSYLLMYHTTFGFSARMIGGNVRAAQASGLPVGRVIFVTCMLAGAAAGLAGMIEIGAVHHRANGSVIAEYGFTGILVSFIARHHPLGIIPVAILFGILKAAEGVVQRELRVPNVSLEVLQGIMFVMILLAEVLYGRFRVFQPREAQEAPAPMSAISLMCQAR